MLHGEQLKMSRTPSDYRKFYTCPNKNILSNDGGQPEGYVTKDGSWAAIPYHTNHKKLMVIHNGEHMYLAPNYEKAVAYIKKQISIEKKLKKKGSLEKFL